ncbi:MAG: ribosomal RNA small subunit methyltransferase A [Clostridia bacterium]|nr:ribosomal RNA small subunit methyltransferase A [Clostridia bacterium]
MGNFEFKKKFGQNFLSDETLLDQIVEEAGVTSEDVVVEIGAGKGALTTALSKKAKKVFSFEIDLELQEYLTNKFSGTNVDFIFEDVMKIADDEINEMVAGRFKLVANLPYYVTSPIITRFLQNDNLDSLTVMVQEEVADRIIAKPKTKDYGVLTIICGLFGESQKVIRVGREKFYPVPNVDSAVVRITKLDKNLDKNKFIGVIDLAKKAFAMRRKKLSSNLENGKISKQMIESLIAQKGFSESARAEELSVEDFIWLYDELKKC